MTNIGKRQVYELAAVMIANDMAPGQIVSGWCRSQEALDAMQAGILNADPWVLDE